MRFLQTLLLLTAILLQLSLCQPDANTNIEEYYVPPVTVNGVTIPRIGFGTAGLQDGTEGAVRVALESGFCFRFYVLIDSNFYSFHIFLCIYYVSYCINIAIE